MSKYLCWVEIFLYSSKVHWNTPNRKKKTKLILQQLNNIYLIFRLRKSKTVNFIIVKNLKQPLMKKKKAKFKKIDVF